MASGVWNLNLYLRFLSVVFDPAALGRGSSLAYLNTGPVLYCASMFDTDSIPLVAFPFFKRKSRTGNPLGNGMSHRSQPGSPNRRGPLKRRPSRPDMSLPSHTATASSRRLLSSAHTWRSPSAVSLVRNRFGIVGKEPLARPLTDRLSPMS